MNYNNTSFEASTATGQDTNSMLTSSIIDASAMSPSSSSNCGGILPGGTVLTSDLPVTSKESEEEKKRRRVLANRRSAKESRERRRGLLEKLSKEVDRLSAENRCINEVNTQLRGEMQVLKQQLMFALMSAKQQQQNAPMQTRQQLPNNYDMMLPNVVQDEPTVCNLGSMLKCDILEPINISKDDSLWNTPDIWEPLMCNNARSESSH